MPQSRPVEAAKSALRAQAKVNRAAIASAHASAAAQALVAGFSQIPNRPTNPVIAGFLSFGGEIDTAPLLQSLNAAGRQLCLPVMQAKTLPLLFRAWSPGDRLETVQWGIREPANHKPALDPDILLVPLLAFDRHGHRLGYGGGYYDRTIHQLRQKKPILAIGLAFDEQQVDAVPHLDYDERLDWVLTPSGPIHCQP